VRSNAYANAQGDGDAEVAPDAEAAPISYSVRTVRFGELASEPREFRHRRRVSGSDALKVAFAGDQEFSDAGGDMPCESVRRDGTKISLRKKY